MNEKSKIEYDSINVEIYNDKTYGNSIDLRLNSFSVKESFKGY
jgi:hypothetical protein